MKYPHENSSNVNELRRGNPYGLSLDPDRPYGLPRSLRSLAKTSTMENSWGTVRVEPRSFAQAADSKRPLPDPKQTIALHNETPEGDEGYSDAIDPTDTRTFADARLSKFFTPNLWPTSS